MWVARHPRDIVEREISRLLEETGRRPLPLERVRLRSDLDRGAVIVSLMFTGGPPFNIDLPRECFGRAAPYMTDGDFVARSEREIFNLYNHLAEGEIHVRRDHLVWAEVAREETMAQLYSDAHWEMVRALMGGVVNEAGTPEANARGLKLLRDWLSPAQLAQYEKSQSFEVIGSHSGKRYRIRYGRQMNIDELGADGAKVCGWCFLPEGPLVAGDVMLAQKIALETDEPAALKVANRFDDGADAGCIVNISRGWLNQVDLHLTRVGGVVLEPRENPALAAPRWLRGDWARLV
jgi:hypothetical protein